MFGTRIQKTIIAVIITLLLGPGGGHLYLRKFKRAAAFMLAALLFALGLAARITGSLKGADLSGINPLQLLQDFSTGNPTMMLVYDVIFAALWAYAVVDVYLIVRRENPPPAPEESQP